MKSIKLFLLLLFLGTHFCHAQDTTLLLKPKMLNKDSMQIFISEMKGWLFKQGNDTAWAKKDIDLTGWKRLMPTELSEKMADKSGRVEGWFRLKIKLDSTLGETAFAVRISTWAASDLYIDGNRIASFGNTGINGAPYRENRYMSNLLPLSVNLKPGIEYTLVFHVVDYLSPFPPYELKAKDFGLRNLIRITVPKYYETIVPEATNGAIFIIFSVISVVLSLLFWLLFLQNRSEKNLLLFATASTLLTIFLIALALLSNSGLALVGMSYSWRWVATQISQLSSILYFSSIPVILARIFKRKIPLLYNIIVFLLVFIGTISLIRLIEIDEKIFTALNFILLCLIIVFSVYYVVSSWKKLRGAQWAIVAGLLIPLSVLLLVFILQYVSQDTLNLSFILVGAFLFLSFPMSMMVYVAMRFKEIIKEVQENAKQVMQMSEEKKEQALHQQKILREEVNRQTAEIRTTLDNLKSTQSQLIQSEKMASLGELTAGIAHEIQNPLNFVNNFSEVSNELIGEMNTELEKGDIEEAKSIATDVKLNLEKINHHGKRAADIVRGMLQHSRTSSGQKEPTDINALCDEYLRLAYHGLRAKDKSFNAKFETAFDETVSKLNIIPQDIGRVILNLINNAFYAASQPSKGGLSDSDNNKTPTVWVSTKKEGNKVLISVRDNGPGIPSNILDKIFQPFFTTKPTGQGTGLGLSLSYDIVKAHGGELKVETIEEEGTTFIITLG
jgi:two-component system, NtrC family, sensor kinase